MNYLVVRSDEAQAEIDVLSPVPRRAVKNAIRDLRRGPIMPNSKKLDDFEHLWRVRPNRRWRIVFELFDDERTILITRVRLREFAYEGLERAPR